MLRPPISFEAWKRLSEGFRSYDALIYRDGDYAVTVFRDGSEYRSTDHADVIQSAVDYVYEKYGGGKIVILGEFILNKSISLNSNIILNGLGETIIKPSTTFTDTKLLYSYGTSTTYITNIEIKNIVFDGNGLDINLLHFHHIQNLEIKNCEFRNTKTSSIDASAIWVEDKTLSVSAGYGDNIVIRNNYFHDLGKHGIKLINPITNVIIDGNRFINLEGFSAGIYPNPNNWSDEFYNAVIANNIVENGGALWVAQGEKVTFVGNVVKGSNSEGIDIERDVYDFAVVGNVIEDAKVGVSLFRVEDNNGKWHAPRFGIVVGNEIRNIHDADGAIRVYAGFVTVANNVIDHTYASDSSFEESGIVVGAYDQDDTLVEKVIVVDNILIDIWGHGIIVHGESRNVRDVIIMNNIIENWTQRRSIDTSKNDGAIVLAIGTVSSSTIERTKVINNIAIDTSGLAIRSIDLVIGTYGSLGSDVEIRNNVSNITPDKTKNKGKATFSGDGSTTQFKIAHGLVSTPSKATVTPCSSDASGSFYVTVDDTYIYVNYSTAPPSGTDNICLYWEAEV